MLRRNEPWLNQYPIPVTNIIRSGGNSVSLRVGEYLLTLKIEGIKPRPSGRLQLRQGQTMYDLVLDAARAFVKDIEESDFSAADLYRTAVERNPGLSIRRNSWSSHVMSSAPNHPSYRHYTSHRDYFRYLGKGKYAFNPRLLLETTGTTVRYKYRVS